MDNLLTSPIHPSNKILFSKLIDDIKYLKGQGNYTLVYFNDGTKSTYPYNLLKFEKQLINYDFFLRIHKSFIVNLNILENIDLEGSFIRLKPNGALPIGNLYKNILKNLYTN